MMLIFICCLIVIVVGFYYLLKPATKKAPIKLSQPMILRPVASSPETVPQDLSPIAGEDILATQLDLARAYIESGKHASAAKLVKLVAKDGTAVQKNEARQLWNRLVEMSPVKPVKQPSR